MIVTLEAQCCRNTEEVQGMLLITCRSQSLVENVLVYLGSMVIDCIVSGAERLLELGVL